MSNWIDGIIGYISPKAGCRREEWREELEARRGYDAADNGRLNSGWRAANEAAENENGISRDIIRARARDMEKNSDIANAILGAYKRNVIGGGYTLQAKTQNEKLNSELEELWREWCKKKNCDITETQNFSQIMRMLVKRKKVDGGMLIHKVYTNGGLLPFKLQCLEMDELDHTQLIPNKAGNKVIGGVELNQYNKAQGYWIRQYSLDAMEIMEPVYIEAQNIIFCFQKDRPTQIREISDMKQTITRIRDANEFMNAVSVKERMLACLSVFIKKTPQTPEGRGVPSTNNKKKYDYGGKKISPGMIKYLNPGEEVNTVNPSGQATDATNYTKQQLRLVGAGQGISYEATSRDMSESNYSSARQGMIEDELTYQEDKELLMDVMDEIYETFVISAVLAGAVKIKDFWGRKRENLRHEWIQAPKKWIDPLKEANANRIAMETGQKTFKQIAAECGRDWKEQLDDMAEIMEYAKEKKIKMGGIYDWENAQKTN